MKCDDKKKTIAKHANAQEVVPCLLTNEEYDESQYQKRNFAQKRSHHPRHDFDRFLLEGDTDTLCRSRRMLADLEKS